MILVGNQRGGAKNLALHLLKDENEHVEVHELKGFASDNLVSALNEVYAVSRGTRCKQFLFSVSLNPPPQENVCTQAFEIAIERVEKKLGLSGQPRAVVFHEKEGRRHAHAVWSRIDPNEMKAVQLSFSKLKLRDISRELYIEHGWKMPRGLMNSRERDLRNFDLAEWQQAKRADKDPREIKTVFQDCWAVSDSRQAFASALEERGYKLARGDRRGFVGVDLNGEVYSVAKWAGIKTKEVRARLGEESALPSVAQRKQEIADQVSKRLDELGKQQSKVHARASSMMAAEHAALVERQQRARRLVIEQQDRRWQQEATERQMRFNRGLRGVLDRITGRHRRIKEQNETETYRAYRRDRAEKDALIFRQLEERRSLQNRMARLRQDHVEFRRQIESDLSRYNDVRKEAHIERRRELARGRSRTGQRGRRRQPGPELEL